MASSRRNNSVDRVSAPPRAGRPYARSAGSSPPQNENWGRIDYPGGRELWWRMVIGFSIVTIVGAVFIVLGAVFFEEAQRIEKEKGISLALTWCVIGIVCGTLLMVTSIVLGRLIISNKWRTNQQPSYARSSRSSRNQVQNEAEEEDSETPSREESTSPPPYGEARSPPTAVFIISRGQVNLTMPAVSSPPTYDQIAPLEPPRYTPEDPCKLPVYGDAEIHTQDTQSSPKPDDEVNIPMQETCDQNAPIQDVDYSMEIESGSNHESNNASQ